METADVLIIGGGVIGLSVAFHLLRSAPNLRVTVADAGHVGAGDRGQASFAAAGMLAPFAEAQTAGPFVRLGSASLDRYPAFIESVRSSAGSVGDPALAITGPGMLRVAVTDEEASRLEALYTWQSALGIPIARLSATDARCLESGLSGDVRIVLHSPTERQVDPRRMTRSLYAACRHLGTAFLESAPVTKIEQCRTGFDVLAGTSEIACGTVVIAGGAWSRTIGCLLHVALPIVPVRGQILALQAASQPSAPLRHTVYASSAYLVPRPEGRVIVGATEEPGAGFDHGVCAEDVAELRSSAAALIPSMAGRALDGPAWAGLRPASRDGLPIMGALPGIPDAHVATGHYRNGILLTPITGEIVAHGILTETPHPMLATELRAERFDTQ